jgi:outer membrane protein assembly factor BamB
MGRKSSNHGGAAGLLVLLSLAALPSCGQASTNPTAVATPDPPGGTSDGSDWPTYGQNTSRTGYSSKATAITAANLARLAPRWQADIGIGDFPPSGAPTVAGGRVFVGSSLADGDNFFAFDAATGAALWTADVGHHPPSDFDVGLGATAGVSDTVVVVGGGDAAYYGLDVGSGAILWRHEMGVGPSGFTWCSPLIANGRAYIGMSSEGDNPSVRGEVRALDLLTGNLLANQYFVPEGLRGAGIWNSPALSPDGRLLAVATGEDYGGYDGPYNRAMVTLDPLTLEILEADKEGATNQDLDWGTTPVFFKDRQSRTLLGANHKNGVFYAYDATKVASGPIWQRDLGVSIGMMPAYDPTHGDGGTLFIVGDNGQLFAVDPATGMDRWPPVAVGFMFGNMALANGLVFASTGGSVVVLDAATGSILRTLTPADPGPSYSGVVVAGGVVYWLSGPKLNAWSLT